MKSVAYQDSGWMQSRDSCAQQHVLKNAAQTTKRYVHQHVVFMRAFSFVIDACVWELGLELFHKVFWKGVREIKGFQ